MTAYRSTQRAKIPKTKYEFEIKFEICLKLFSLQTLKCWQWTKICRLGFESATISIFGQRASTVIQYPFLRLIFVKYLEALMQAGLTALL